MLFFSLSFSSLKKESVRLENSNESFRFVSAANTIMSLLLESRDEQIWMREMKKMLVFFRFGFFLQAPPPSLHLSLFLILLTWPLGHVKRKLARSP